MRGIGLVDIEELVLQCHNDEARDFVEEAVDAYKAGAYRSAIVSTWLAVYFDLVSKLKSLSIAGNEEAEAWISRYEKALDDYSPGSHNTAVPLLRLESEILNKAKADEIGLISGIELTDLKRLKTDRNRCAHPTMRNKHDRFSPSAELARTHLRNAVEHVLSRPAVQGQLAVERLLALCSDEGFPTRTADAIEVLRGSDINGVDDRNLPAVITGLLRDILDEEVSALARSQRLAALEAVRDIMRPVFDDTFANSFSSQTESPDETTWIIIVGLIRRAQWIWSLLDVIQKNRMRRLIASTSVDEGNGRVIISEVLSINELRDQAKQRLQEFSLTNLRRSEDRIPKEVIIDEGVRRLTNSDSWSTTYSLIDTLLRPDVMELNRSHVAAILTAFESNNDVSGSYAALPLLRSILEKCSDGVVGAKEEWDWVRDFAAQPDIQGGSRFLTAYQEKFGNAQELSTEELG